MSSSTAAIVSIGNELTLGQVVDTNTAWLASQLAEIGITTALHLTIGDDEQDIRAAIVQAAGKAPIVIVSGGLGPTLDDVTRQGLARALGTDLVEDAASLEKVKAFFAQRGRTMPEANRVQALVPVGAAAIENTCGTAPGIRAELGGSVIYVVPGVPREMKVMFDLSIRPEVLTRAGGRAMAKKMLLCFGAGESDIAAQIADLMDRNRNPLVGTTPHETIIGIRIVARGGSPAEAQALLEKDAAECRRRLGSLVFGENEQTLADAVAARLSETGRTVAVAESCTGGLVARMLTEVAGSSAYFLRGYVTYSNESKIDMLGVPPELIERHGAVSEQVARAMVAGCRQRSGADYAVAITGIAGPTGGTAEKPVGLVYVAAAGPAAPDGSDNVDVRRLTLGEHLLRWQIRDRAAKVALNMLRLAV